MLNFLNSYIVDIIKYMKVPLIVGLLLSISAAMIGVVLVLKRYSMIGDGLSHVGFGSVAIALALGTTPLLISIPVVMFAAYILLRLGENKKINGDADADVIDVYEALDMFLPGLMAYRSVLNGGIPVDIPNLREKTERDKYRNDTACTDPKVAGDMLIPVFSEGNPEISNEVYEEVAKEWRKRVSEKKIPY